MYKKRFGIDAGGSLLKICYEENGRFHYKKYEHSQMDTALNFLNMLSPDAQVVLTGGKALELKRAHFPQAFIFPEFSATCEGAAFLLKETNHHTNNPLLLVNIGTGTSWYILNGDSYERVFGSGLGGGTFLGLGKLLSNENRYSELCELSAKGNKNHVDLLVKDIYPPDDSPINGELTASNFGKVDKTMHSDKDRVASLANMLAETLVLLSVQTAKLHQVNDVIYIGNTIVGNEHFRSLLVSYTKALGCNPLFIKNGEYSGALGALLSAK